MQRAMHNTCIKHGRDIRTQCIGSTSILLLRKYWSSIRHDRTLSFFLKHSQFIVFPKLLGWKLVKSYTRKYMRYLDLPKISFKDNWMEEMGSEVAQRPEGQVGQQFQSSQSNQPIPNTDRGRTEQSVIRTDRTGERVVGTDTRTAQDERKNVPFSGDRNTFFS